MLERFFTPPHEKAVRWYQSGLSILVIIHILMSYEYVEIFFSDVGIISSESVYDLAAWRRFSIFFYFDKAWFVFFSFHLGLLAALALLINCLPIISSFFCFILLASIDSRFPVIDYMGFTLNIIGLFFLSVFHLLSLVEKKWCENGRQFYSMKAWPIRMIQLQVCIIYFIGAVHKIADTGWYHGQELMEILVVSVGRFDLTWMQFHRTLVAAASYATIFIELSFPYLVWFSATRRFCLMGIIGMHLSLELLINTVYFNHTMLVSLLLFLTESELGAEKRPELDRDILRNQAAA